MVTKEVIATQPALDVSIELMTEHDLLEVVEIEGLSGLSPWGWDAYHKELQSGEDVIMLVARIRAGAGTPHDKRALAGFIVSRMVVDELHINNVAIRDEFRRQGIATRLLNTVLEWGRGKSARTALLEVRAGNAAAQRLYSGCGFLLAGRRIGYYSQPLEDALLMSVSLKSSP
jgi:[ribosomal protein S18]-alanine N-acetyltransferase